MSKEARRARKAVAAYERAVMGRKRSTVQQALAVVFIRAVLMDLIIAWALMVLLGIVHHATLVGGCGGSTPVACAPAHSPVPAFGYGLCVGITFLVLIVTYPFRKGAK